MRDWLRQEPIVIVEGQGAWLRDARGKEYLDANSSIWTNLHGHNHPALNEAIVCQLRKVAHSSALGLANEPASLLADRLVEEANPAVTSPVRLEKVFFSDDGSTAVEVALKLAYEFSRRTGRTAPRFASMGGAYHGDTVGAVSLGHIDLFHRAYSGLLFESEPVMSPCCYRCRFNRARPERADAREYRRCDWECIGEFEKSFQTASRKGRPISAFVFEPLVQGAAGMVAQPPGWLARVTEIARGHGALLIADEVMTGFGRAGFPPSPSVDAALSTAPGARVGPAEGLFACALEQVCPDFLALAKGLTGGYLPMAATLTTQAVFDAFLGEYEEFKTFFHGHSFTANQLGAAAACASLNLLASPESVQARKRIQLGLANGLRSLWDSPWVGDIRQVGLVAGIELVRDWRTREPFAPAEKAGIRVCEAMAHAGVLTRSIGNVVVLMPPYCTTEAELQRMIQTLREALNSALGRGETSA